MQLVGGEGGEAGVWRRGGFVVRFRAALARAVGSRGTAVGGGAPLVRLLVRGVGSATFAASPRMTGSAGFHNLLGIGWGGTDFTPLLRTPTPCWPPAATP